VMCGVGELLSPPVTLPQLAAVLANPGVALPTRAVFDKFAGTDGSKNYIKLVPRARDDLIAFLQARGNDLTPAAIVCEPAVGDVLMTLRALPGVRLARMAGS